MKRKRKFKKRVKRFFCMLLLAAVFIGTVKCINVWKQKQYFVRTAEDGALMYLKNISLPDWVDVQLIHVHNTARTGASVNKITNIVIHYVGNPGSTAKNNRDYFDKDSTGVSSHFVVGLEGEIIQCLPLWERSAASNWRNSDTISIEVCHLDETGQFCEATYNAVVKLTAYLLHELALTPDDVIRHYDITGKLCPLYYVENADAWEGLKNSVAEALKALETT